MGLLGNSTATVIGAMIVAPLMTPIMATAAALVMGRLDRAAASALLVLAGVAAVIGLAWAAGALYPGVVDFETNSQISRAHLAARDRPDRGAGLGRGRRLLYEPRGCGRLAAGGGDRDLARAAAVRSRARAGGGRMGAGGGAFFCS